MTLREYRNGLRELLRDQNPEEADALTDMLLCAGLQTERGRLLASLDEETTDELEEFCGKAVYELSCGKPVQYVLGVCCFYGLDIAVGEGVFIPRSDTELCVETALKLLPQGGLFADLCSGSGCIAKAIAVNRKDCRGYALELSRKALSYTLRNLDGVENVEVLRFDVLDDEEYAALSIKETEQFDLLVSNPPYIPTEEIQWLSSDVQYEPETALDGGEDGLRYYRAIGAYAQMLLKPNGSLLFEIGYDQADAVSDILENLGYHVAIFKDYSKNDRIVLAKRG